MRIVYTVLLITLICGFSHGQKPEKAFYSIEGTIKSYEPVRGFAIDNVLLETGDEVIELKFPSHYAQRLYNSFKPGDIVKVEYWRPKAGVGKEPDAKLSKLTLNYLYTNRVTKVWNGAQQVEIGNERPTYLNMANTRPWNPKVFIEKEIEEVIFRDDEVLAVSFEGDVVSGVRWFGYKPDEHNYSVGDKVSFYTYPYYHVEGERLIVDSKHMYYGVNKLKAASGKIKSFLYKQNFAYIGFKLQTNSRTLDLFFPSEKAEQVVEIAERNIPVLAYYSSRSYVKPDGVSLFALIAGKDTLKMEKSFVGAPDGGHKYEDAQVEGKITAIEKAKTGLLMYLLIDNEFYIESTPKLSKQLAPNIKKGMIIGVKGQKRIKRQGEVYQKEYQIIRPKAIIINGQEFILSQ
ncbi:MAG: hypothetical protein AAFX87_12845 [Bacteroidota bacterium]